MKLPHWQQPAGRPAWIRHRRIILSATISYANATGKVLALHAMTTVNIAVAATERGLWQIASQAGLLP